MSDRVIAELEQNAGRCKTARLALDKYEAFVACHELTERQRTSIDARMKVWKQRVDAGLYRVGNQWLTEAAAKEIGNAADELIDAAYAKMELGEYKRAKELLEKAARVDPSGIRADYVLGMIYSPNLWNYAPSAEKHFAHAWRRDPENPTVANNLAISRVKMGQYSEALDLWASALRSGIEVPDIVHNLGRFAQEVRARRITATEAHRKRAEKIYDRALTDRKGPPTSETTGWMYSRLVLPADERARSRLVGKETPKTDDNGADPPPELLIEVSSGTGFVIAPGIVLTNRHVANGGTSFLIPEPAKPDTLCGAGILAVCKDLDLALLRCESLQAPAVTLKPGALRRGTDVMVLGFPLSPVLGTSLKAVRGAIYGFDEKHQPGAVLYDAATNPGNSGGPVCDNTGSVVAVHFAGIDLSVYENAGGKLGLGVPVEKALPFIREFVSDLQTDAPDTKLDWPDIDQRVSRSTVYIRVLDSVVNFVARAPTQKADSLFEDRTCVVCKGRRVIPCPVKGCYRGSVSDFENSYMVVENGYGQSAFRFQKPKLAACEGCHGAGIVDCPHCRDGLDPRLK